jgi:hypothetical protein
MHQVVLVEVVEEAVVVVADEVHPVEEVHLVVAVVEVADEISHLIILFQTFFFLNPYCFGCSFHFFVSDN